MDKVLHNQGLLFVYKAIQTKRINRVYDDFLAGNFNIQKTQELIAS